MESYIHGYRVETENNLLLHRYSDALLSVTRGIAWRIAYRQLADGNNGLWIFRFQDVSTAQLPLTLLLNCTPSPAPYDLPLSAVGSYVHAVLDMHPTDGRNDWRWV